MELEVAHYAQGDAFQREKRCVFAQAWLPIAVKEQLARPGQFVTSATAGWPMLAVCGTDGVLRAFRNICRHRDLSLVETDAGACESFRCRHHGWTYDLSGAFTDAPPAITPAGDRSQQALTPVAMHVLRQVVLVNWRLDAPAADWGGVDSVLGTQAQAYPHYAGARMKDIGCNWKTLLECVLADERAEWHWPTMFMHIDGGAWIIDHIVPRTFLRTRVIRHAYVVAPAYEGDAQPALGALDELKTRAEQLQGDRVQGKRADTAQPRIAALHAQLITAYARHSMEAEV